MCVRACVHACVRVCARARTHIISVSYHNKTTSRCALLCCATSQYNTDDGGHVGVPKSDCQMPRLMGAGAPPTKLELMSPLTKVMGSHQARSLCGHHTPLLPPTLPLPRPPPPRTSTLNTSVPSLCWRPWGRKTQSVWFPSSLFTSVVGFNLHI